jgi:ketosteroid isomerase-like protein
MENAGEVLRNFYAAVVKRDLTAVRACPADDMVFEGLFEAYRSADEEVGLARRCGLGSTPKRSGGCGPVLLRKSGRD